jgi:hypothetical protein
VSNVAKAIIDWCGIHGHYEPIGWKNNLRKHVLSPPVEHARNPTLAGDSRFRRAVEEGIKTNVLGHVKDFFV